MNTLTDLRRTLDRRADDVADPAAVARTAAIHHRVSVVRRQRAAGAAFAVALALVAGSAAVLLPRTDSGAGPAAPTVLGVKAPTTQTSLGFTYRTDGRSSTFAGSGKVDIHATDRPQLLSWTTSRKTEVTLVLPDGDVWHSQATRFSDFVVIPAGESGKLEVSVASGSVGLASYAATDAIPRGAVSKDGVTYRAAVANTPLLSGLIGDRGQTVLRSSYVAPRGPINVTYTCSGLSDSYWINISLNHQGRVSSGGLPCDGSGVFDAGTLGGAGFPQVGKPGSRVSVKVWLSRGAKGRVLQGSVPDVRLSAGIYGPQGQVHVGGTTVAQYVEYDGHTWAYAGSTTRRTGRDLRLPASGVDRVAAMAFHTREQSMIYFAAGTRTQGSATQSKGSGALPQLWVPAGAPVHVHLKKAVGSYGVAFYRRVD